MISAEYFAISAIFITGFYIGFKIKGGLYNLRTYLKENFSKE
jgi:hypothetical protein